MRLNWNYRGNIVEVPAFHNYMVDPDFRHAAGFFLLMKALSNEQHALMPGTGRVTSEIYEKLGFQEAKTSWYLKILRPIHGAFIMSARKFLSRPFRARYFDSPRLEETSSSGFSVTLSPTDDLLEQLVGAMNSHEPEVAAPLWTVEQLKWRFFHSLGPRHLLIYEDSPRTIRSFAILSLGPRRGLNLGRIVELNAASVDSLSTLVHKYTNVFLGGGFQFVHELVQVVTSKFPLKRLSNGGVMLLKAQKPFFEGLQGKEVVRGKNFALDNGEIDLDLVQPTRMDGSVDGDDSRIFALKPADAAGSPVSRSIVQNPEDSSGFFIGSLGHDLIDQAAKRSNPIFSFTATEELGPMHIQCCQISPSAAARVFMFHLHRDAGLRGEGSMPTAACLDAGFFVGGEDEFTVFQGMPQPHSLIQVEDTPRFFGEMGVSRENPAAMLPRADGVLMEPAPDGGPADAGDQPGLAHLGGQIGAAPSRDGQSEGGGQLTGQGFNLDHYLWGEKTGGDPAESYPPDPSGVFRKSAFARNIPPLDGYPNVSRSHHYANPGLPGESSWLAVPENTVTYIFGHEPIVLFPHLAIERSYTGCVEALWNSFQVTTMPNQPDIIR